MKKKFHNIPTIMIIKFKLSHMTKIFYFQATKKESLNLKVYKIQNMKKKSNKLKIYKKN